MNTKLIQLAAFIRALKMCEISTKHAQKTSSKLLTKSKARNSGDQEEIPQSTKAQFS